MAALRNCTIEILEQSKINESTKPILAFLQLLNNNFDVFCISSTINKRTAITSVKLLKAFYSRITKTSKK